MGTKIFRIVFICIAYAIMWIKPDSTLGFFRSLFVLTSGFVYDYWSLCAIGIEEDDKYHQWLGGIGCALAVSFLALSVFPLMGLAELVMGDNVLIKNTSMFMVNFEFNLNIVLIILTIFPFLAGFEIYGEHRRFSNVLNKKGENLSDKGVS